MGEKVELKVNVINQLRLLRQSTFKDVLCFLDEDIQNAQRAKATEVRVAVDTYDKTIIIENNGQILTNPQALFSIAESGWDDDVKKSENPFGMGFFSNMTVSNLIEIHSGNLYITFDVDKMINTNNTDILVEEIDDIYKGFKLILNNVDFNKIYRSEVQERVYLLGKYIQELDIYYNDELQEKKELSEGDDSIFQIQVDEEDFKGWIALGNSYWVGDNLNIFYKGRLVCKLENIPFLKGDIHISDKTLNLTSPDRKDIIRDEKYYNFRESIKTYAKLLCENSLINGDEEDVENLANSIAYYVDKSKVKNKLKFATFKSQNESDIKYLKDIAIAKKENKNINSFRNFQLYLDKQKNKQPESHFEEVVINTNLKSEVKAAKGTIIHHGSSSYSEGYVEKPEIKEDEIQEKKGETIINNEVPVFWLSFDDVAEHEYKLNMIKHYNLKIIVARNKIEAEILKSMKETDKVLHISELNEKISFAGYLTNTELNKKEQRALMVLDLISRILGVNYNIFSIGDLMATKTVIVDSLDIKNEIIEENVVVLKDDNLKKVYVDRSMIDLSDLEESYDSKLTIKDYKFILSNIYNLIDQASLIVSGKGQNILMREVLEALGKGIV